MSSTDMQTVINASSQIMAPFDASPLQIRLSEITTDATGLLPKVTWSVGQNTTPYKQGESLHPASVHAETKHILCSE